MQVAIFTKSYETSDTSGFPHFHGFPVRNRVRVAKGLGGPSIAQRLLRWDFDSARIFLTTLYRCDTGQLCAAAPTQTRISEESQSMRSGIANVRASVLALVEPR